MDRAVEPAILDHTVFQNEAKSLWVFGYGSLCWKPGFKFEKAVLGSVIGYKRRFWQGNVTHRGTLEKPGRVVTLIEDSEGEVHGIAYAVSGEAAIPYLNRRECEQGGYISNFKTFYPLKGEPFKVLVYVATPLNNHWLGDGNADEIAEQIANCQGASGHNVEYLVRLADFMRLYFPNKHDHHLFSIEKKVRSILDYNQMCFKTLMGSGEGCIRFLLNGNLRESSPTLERREDRVETFEHTTRVPDKKLRCLNL